MLALKRDFDIKSLIGLGFKKSELSANNWKITFYRKSIAIQGLGYFDIEVADWIKDKGYQVQVTDTTGSQVDCGSYKPPDNESIKVLEDSGIHRKFIERLR